MLTSGTKVQEITGSKEVLLINGVIMVQLLTKEHLLTSIATTIVQLLTTAHLLTCFTMVKLLNHDTKPPLITGNAMVQFFNYYIKVQYSIMIQRHQYLQVLQWCNCLIMIKKDHYLIMIQWHYF